MNETAMLKFLDRHLRLIEQERQYEIVESQQDRQRHSLHFLKARGVCLAPMILLDENAGLEGRVLLTLSPAQGGSLPNTRIGPGDIVTLTEYKSEQTQETWDAVVYRRQRESIVVALDELPEAGLPELLRIDRVANDTTYKCWRSALEQLRKLERGCALQLRDVAFGLREPGWAKTAREIVFFDPALDPAQREAVRFALSAQTLALIHGPPGTGKTTAVIEILRQAVNNGERVLCCAPSNVAVDNLVERLVPFGLKIVRLGHPARLLPSVLAHGLDSLVNAAPGTQVVNDLRRERLEVLRSMRKINERNARREARESLKRLRKEIATFERTTIEQIIENAQIVLTTNTGAGDYHLRRQEFELVVIDEAAQAIEASCWIPLTRGRRAVLVGDHRQLPPSIRDLEAERAGLGITLFERLQNLYGEQLTRMLNRQYRMHSTIMAWSSNALYAGRLEAAPQVATHLLCELPSVEKTLETNVPLVFIDTAGCDFLEAQEREGASRFNTGEATLLQRYLELLISAGVPVAEIAIVTPYRAQVQLLRERLQERYPVLEIDSVDGFQGREKEAVLISMVRSNEHGEVGFLADRRRMNVAVTRARRHLALIGDSATLSRDPFLLELLNYCERNGSYRTVWEFET